MRLVPDTAQQPRRRRRLVCVARHAPDLTLSCIALAVLLQNDREMANKAGQMLTAQLQTSSTSNAMSNLRGSRRIHLPPEFLQNAKLAAGDFVVVKSALQAKELEDKVSISKGHGAVQEKSTTFVVAIAWPSFSGDAQSDSSASSAQELSDRPARCIFIVFSYGTVVVYLAWGSHQCPANDKEWVERLASSKATSETGRRRVENLAVGQSFACVHQTDSQFVRKCAMPYCFS